MPARITCNPTEKAFVDAICEAAVIVDRWPVVLQNLADHYGAGGRRELHQSWLMLVIAFPGWQKA